MPVFANGNVLYSDDVDKCLAFTGADAYMSAEPQLHNPAIFLPATSTASSTVPPPPIYPFHTDVALEYLDIVASLKTTTSPSAVKAHLFKLLHPALSRETDLRDRLGQAKVKDGFSVYVTIVSELGERMRVSPRRMDLVLPGLTRLLLVREMPKPQHGIPMHRELTIFPSTQPLV